MREFWNVHASKQAALTGESLPVNRDGLVFMGTAVTTGTGKAEVVATGMKTGSARSRISSTAESSLRRFRRSFRGRKMLLALCLVVVTFVLGIGLAQGGPGSAVVFACHWRSPRCQKNAGDRDGGTRYWGATARVAQRARTLASEC